MTLHFTDRPALAVTALVALPVAAGLIWAGATTPDLTGAAVAAMFLVAWLVAALPVALFTGRWLTRHTSGLDEEGQ